ncbi:hypothetical protein U0070_007772 [Myodes glareolus]|uniref:Uncharacterized protein n=1 Tax=Myodes glareolus TaxID=447135 RepID=A0AAW0IL35_MYOGA
MLGFKTGPSRYANANSNVSSQKVVSPGIPSLQISLADSSSLTTQLEQSLCCKTFSSDSPILLKAHCPPGCLVEDDWLVHGVRAIFLPLSERLLKPQPCGSVLASVPFHHQPSRGRQSDADERVQEQAQLPKLLSPKYPARPGSPGILLEVPLPFSEKKTRPAHARGFLEQARTAHPRNELDFKMGISLLLDFHILPGTIFTSDDLYCDRLNNVPSKMSVSSALELILVFIQNDRGHSLVSSGGWRSTDPRLQRAVSGSPAAAGLLKFEQDSSWPLGKK